MPSKKKILVVDDENEMVQLITAIFAEDGYEVISAAGRHALNLAADTQPDVILLDLMMPGMGGASMLRELRHDLKTQRIPVIVISGLAKIRTAVLMLGANDFVEKPFNVADLEQRVNDITHLEDSTHGQRSHH